jgi:hypothetical protein
MCNLWCNQMSVGPRIIVASSAVVPQLYHNLVLDAEVAQVLSIASPGTISGEVREKSAYIVYRGSWNCMAWELASRCKGTHDWEPSLEH